MGYPLDRSMSKVQSQEVIERFHRPLIRCPHSPKGHPLLKKVRILALGEIELSLQREDAPGAVFEVIGSHNGDLPENRKILPGRHPPVTQNRAVFHGHSPAEVSCADATEKQFQKNPPQSQQHPENLTLDTVKLQGEGLSRDKVNDPVEFCTRLQYLLFHPGPPCSMDSSTNPLGTRWPRRTVLFSHPLRTEKRGAHDDMNNLLASTQVGTIFLDTEMN